MKSLSQYIIESKEDGKYVELPSNNLYDPKKYRSPMHYSIGKKPEKESVDRRPNGSKYVRKLSDEQYQSELSRYNDRLAEYKKKIKGEDDAYKAQVDTYKKIDAENFEILIDKVLKTISSQKNRDAFIQMEVSSILEAIKNMQSKNVSLNELTYKEEQLQDILTNFRMSLTSDDEVFVKLYGRINLNKHHFEKNVYDSLCYIAKLYNVEVPRFSQFKDDNILISVNQRMDAISSSRRHMSEEQYSKRYKKEQEKWEKDKAKVKKYREAFAKSDLYKNLEKIAEIFEDDIETIEKSVNRAYTRYDELNGKNRAYAEARSKVSEIANDEIENYFGDTFRAKAVSCYGKSLVDILTILYLNGDKEPKIECIDKKTSSWLSGMIHSCKFKVTASDGTEYTTGTYEDRGFDSFDREPGDGFGPYD